jgi:enoyl-[acyl-carrier protein] reductase/trans-2-enoyl-CoA reductase (NAD+)
VDTEGRIRIDDWEMRADVQREVADLWQKIDQENIGEMADLRGLKEEFLRHHGFGMPGVDYSQDVKPDIF